MRRYKIILTVFVVVLLNSLTVAYAGESLEYQLATINAGGYVPQDHITVARFRSLLSQLSSAFVENRQQIADMSITAQQLLRQDGIEESLLNIMEGMNKLLSRNVGNRRYIRYASAYVTLRSKGYSHSQAVGGLRVIIRSKGKI
jgi:hypothetical protein